MEGSNLTNKENACKVKLLTLKILGFKTFNISENGEWTRETARDK